MGELYYCKKHGKYELDSCASCVKLSIIRNMKKKGKIDLQ